MADLEAVRTTLRTEARQGPRFQVSRDVKASRAPCCGSSLTSDQSEFAADPAQVLNCPCCDQPLAIMRSRKTHVHGVPHPTEHPTGYTFWSITARTRKHFVPL